MKKTKQRPAAERPRLQNLLLLTLAGIVNAFGVTVFLAPVKLYDSGVSGTSMLLSQLTPPWLSLSLFLILLNVPLFLYGLRRQGKLFTFYAIYAVAIYSVSAWLITDVIPLDVSFASPMAGTDLLLCALFGGLISGLGSGLAIRAGGAMDGFEVLAVIFARPLGITVGTFMMIYNVILYVVCGCILKSWILPLYSVIAYTVALKAVDYVVEGIDREKCAMIVTARGDEVCAAISAAFGTGLTRMEGRGGYSNDEKTVIHFVLNRFQIFKLKETVHDVDPSAYIAITEVADVFKARRQHGA